MEQSKEIGVGVIARDDKGVVFSTTWCDHFRCGSALETEACVEGLRLATQWCHSLIIIKLDYSRIVDTMRTSAANKSEIRFVIAEARELALLLSE